MIDILDPKALRYFATAARIGSIRGAAEYMDLAPSIVSRSVAEMEARFGLPLFERTARGVVLTEAGHLVLEHARRIGDDRTALGDQLDQLRGIQQGRIRITCGEGFVSDLIDNGLRSFVDTYPTVTFGLHLGSTDLILDAVSNSETDIGIIYNPIIETRIKSIAIARQPLCLIARPDHPLLRGGPVPLGRCLAEPCALLTKGHGVRQLIGRVAADAGLALAPVLETPSIDVLRRLVIAGLGVTFLPRFAVSAELARGIVGTVELTDPYLAQASAHLIVRAGRRLPFSVDRLVGHLSRELVAFGRIDVPSR